jgi:hypothetical protein
MSDKRADTTCSTDTFHFDTWLFYAKKTLLDAGKRAGLAIKPSYSKHCQISQSCEANEIIRNQTMRTFDPSFSSLLAQLPVEVL